MTDQTKPVEQAPAQVIPVPGQNYVSATTQQVAVEPTQMRRPWQATIRTIFQALVALLTLLPLLALEVYDSPDAYPAVVAQVLAVAALVARLMATPGVEEFLRRFLPFLAAAPPPNPPDQPDEQGGVDLWLLGVVAIIGGLIVWFTTTANLLGLVLVLLGIGLLLYGVMRPGSRNQSGLTTLEVCGIIGAVGVVVIVLLMTGVLDIGDGGNR